MKVNFRYLICAINSILKKGTKWGDVFDKKLMKLENGMTSFEFSKNIMVNQKLKLERLKKR